MIELTVTGAAREFRIDRAHMKNLLDAAGYDTGPGRKVSIAQVVEATFENRKLELEAKAAKHREAIARAQIAENEREIQEGKLGYCSHFRYILTDGLTKVVQIIRGSALSKRDQEEIVAEIGAIKLGDMRTP